VSASSVVGTLGAKAVQAVKRRKETGSILYMMMHIVSLFLLLVGEALVVTEKASKKIFADQGHTFLSILLTVFHKTKPPPGKPDRRCLFLLTQSMFDDFSSEDISIANVTLSHKKKRSKWLSWATYSSFTPDGITRYQPK
jgi:hypothetical protein